MTCNVEGCEREVRKTGMCGAHYAAAWRARNPDKVKAAAERAKADGRAAAASQRWRERNPEKVKEQGGQRYANDPEGQRQRTRQWRQQNPEKVKAIYERARADGRMAAATRRWTDTNVERVRETQREYRRKNRDRRAAAMKAWQQKNREHVAAYDAAYKKANPDVRRRANHARRARLLTAQMFDVSGKDMRRLYSSPCFYCGMLKDRRTVDHLIPVSRGGSHGIGNLVPCCQNCNSSKGSKLPIEFRIWLMRVAAA